MKDAPLLEPNPDAISLDDAEEAKEVQPQDEIASRSGHIDGTQVDLIHCISRVRLRKS
jgi:hypothetical protein